MNNPTADDVRGLANLALRQATPVYVTFDDLDAIDVSRKVQRMFAAIRTRTRAYKEVSCARDLLPNDKGWRITFSRKGTIGNAYKLTDADGNPIAVATHTPTMAEDENANEAARIGIDLFHKIQTSLDKLTRSPLNATEEDMLFTYREAIARDMYESQKWPIPERFRA